jgi:hypothetical protein
MEMIWKMGTNNSKEEIFTGALYDGYGPPSGTAVK